MQGEFFRFVEINLGDNYNRGAGALKGEANTGTCSAFAPEEGRRVNTYGFGDSDITGTCKMEFQGGFYKAKRVGRSKRGMSCAFLVGMVPWRS